MLSDTPPPMLVPPVPLAGISGFVQCLEGVVTPRECHAIVAAAEASGFDRAGFYTDSSTGAPVVVESIRKSQRCIMDSAPFAAALWARIRHAVPSRLPNGLYARRLNERLRILKYLPGDEFKPHRDGSYGTPDGTEIGQLTVLLYLNDGYVGGHTTYFNAPEDVGHPERAVPVTPAAGAVVIQDQALFHAVPPLQTGVKYALRTEVMYGCAPIENSHHTVDK